MSQNFERIRRFSEKKKKTTTAKDSWPRGSTGVQRYGRVSRGVRQTTWERSLKNWSSKSLVLKSFWVERTFWDSSLLVSLTLWDTPVLFTPPLPLPLEFRWIQKGFTAERLRDDSGVSFQWGFRPKSQSWADPQNPNRIAQKRNPNRFRCCDGPREPQDPKSPKK